jgi:putative ABC transport system permease protein
MNLDEIIYALKNLMQRGLRSWLTIVSIVIGIMSIFAIISFGLGLQKYVDTLAEQSGTDKLFIQARGVGAPGTDDTFKITGSEVEFIGKIKGVKEIAGLYMYPGEIKFKDERKYAFVTGYDIEKHDFITEAFTVNIEDGRKLKKKETGRCMLGSNYQKENKFFKNSVKLGDKIEINGYKCEVVGFFGEVGNPQDDSNVYLTLEGMETIYPEIKDNYGFIMARAEKGVDPEELAEKIKERLRKKRGEDEGKETFFVQTFADALETFNAIFVVLNGILVLIALISLIVAGVNIMNTMYTSVLERTREIGIMKAIGAKNTDILTIFIIESGVLGMVGGGIGVFIGYLIADAGGKFAASAGFSLLKPIFPLYLIIGCILFAFLIGAIAGILPAVQASKLNPVDALRSNE